ncbi:MAG: hypothetical protein KDI81_12920, partial [Xanthomonadales bacterium]|nr:hypothetical protein [Xanthomonadales bacterium]
MQTLGIGERQWPHDHAADRDQHVDDRAEARRQHADHQQREGGLAGDGACRLFQFMADGLHDGTSPEQRMDVSGWQQLALFIAQRVHRRHARGLNARDQAGQQRRRAKHGNDQGQDQRIGSPNPVQLRRDQATEGQRAEQADADTGQDHAQAAAKNQPMHRQR